MEGDAHVVTKFGLTGAGPSNWRALECDTCVHTYLFNMQEVKWWG